MYFDTSYIAKFYFNEPESAGIRELVRKSDVIHSSLWAYAEFHAVLHRHVREGALSSVNARYLASSFSRHIDDGLWKLIPVNEGVLRRTSVMILSAPGDLVHPNVGDAVHLTTAQDAGEREVWTNDRHMLAAAAHCGLSGRST